MNVIKQADEKVAKIIQKKTLKPDVQYRLSRYCYPYAYQGNFLIAHLLSYEVVKLNEQEWDALQTISQQPVSASFLTENGLEQLALSRYIVESDYDEVEQYDQLIFLLKTMAGNKKGLRAYTILPTTGCNARCVYCYEENYAVKTMTQETADRLVEYICETRQEDTIRLTWFGGEPLANAKIIRHICAALRERGVPFKSRMITNASLLTKELAHEAKEEWNLGKVQVSLDGAREDYEKRKNYISPEKYHYDRVMQAIGYLADEGIRVSLRCNYDKENIPGIRRMIDDLAVRFGGRKNVSLYFHILFQQNDKDDFVDQIQAIDEACVYAESVGLLHESALRKKFHLNFCMADNMEASVVVAPDGSLYSCEHLPEDGKWGSIFDGVTDAEKYAKLQSKACWEAECAECPFLSFCTAFRKKNCPDIPKYCREEKQVEIERHLRSLIRSGIDMEHDDEEL